MTMHYSSAVIMNVQLDSRQMIDDDLAILEFIGDSEFMPGPLEQIDAAFPSLEGIGPGKKRRG